MSESSVLTIIPAKEHSRRVPGKNMREVGGAPLMARAVKQARLSGVCGLIHVATDSEKVARVAREAGAHVPFLRKYDVDDVTSVGEAAVNVLRRYREEFDRQFDFICLLLATSPLREPEDIRNCREVLMSDPDLDAAGSVVRAEKHPAWAWRVGQDNRMEPMFPELCELDRLELDIPYYYDGAVYWARAEFFDQVGGNQYAGRIGAYVMAPEHAVDVDTELDLEFARFLCSQRKEG